MSVLIFTEGGGQIGLGHISRCSALYDELDSRGIEVQFIIYGVDNDSDMIRGKSFSIVDWLSVEFLNQYINENDYCIVDSYLANEDLYKVIAKRAKKSLFIDDNARIKYPRGILVNPSLSTKAFRYPKSEENCYLLGPDYIILRKAFMYARRKELKAEVSEVLITLGGSDMHDLTLSILKQLSVKYANIKFNAVIRDANKSIEVFEDFRTHNIIFHKNITALEMKNIMGRSDCAITAAGQTIYELLATQTPFIPIKIAENQNNNIAGLKEYGLLGGVIDYKEIGFLEMLEIEFEKLLSFNKRIEKVNSYGALVDGFGTKRIIDALI